MAQVDVELDPLGANTPVDVTMLGDVSATLEAVLAELEHRGHWADGWRAHDRARGAVAR